MATKTINRTTPSANETFPSLSKNTVKAVNTNRIGMSRVIACFLTTTGAINAVAPRISAMFAILEPYAFPSASCGELFIAENIDTTISGADVPKPTITIPIRKVLIPKNWATPTAPSTNRSALQTKIIRPATIATTERIMLY